MVGVRKNPRPKDVDFYWSESDTGWTIHFSYLVWNQAFWHPIAWQKPCCVVKAYLPSGHECTGEYLVSRPISCFLYWRTGIPLNWFSCVTFLFFIFLSFHFGLVKWDCIYTFVWISYNISVLHNMSDNRDFVQQGFLFHLENQWERFCPS